MTEVGFAIGAAAYTRGEAFQRERRTVFARSWLLFAASAQLAKPGDYIAHSFGGWPLFAIRGEDGVARVFHNVCRHQGMPVVEGAAGNCEALRCRYHGWTYGLDGAFYGAPPRSTPAEPPGDLALSPVELIERDGLCSVRVQPGDDVAPREIAPPSGRFAAAVATDVDANWKAVVEALLGEAGWHFVWPVAFVAADERPGCRAVRQIVPRSFLRTRIVDLLFSDDGVLSGDAERQCRGLAAADKATAETVQAERAAGTAAEPRGAFADFVERLEVAGAAYPGCSPAA